jgi:hypothetical protein
MTKREANREALRTRVDTMAALVCLGPTAVRCRARPAERRLHAVSASVRAANPALARWRLRRFAARRCACALKHAAAASCPPPRPDATRHRAAPQAAPQLAAKAPAGLRSTRVRTRLAAARPGQARPRPRVALRRRSRKLTRCCVPPGADCCHLHRSRPRARADARRAAAAAHAGAGQGFRGASRRRASAYGGGAPVGRGAPPFARALLS